MIKLLSKLFIKDYKNYSNNKVRESYIILSGIVGIIFNIICSLGKMILGFIINSISIISDGFNNLSDTLSNIVSIFSAKLANKKPDKDHPFGHGRFEYIGSLVISFIIIFIAVELLIQSILKIIQPVEIIYSKYLLIILIITIIIKLYMFIYNYIYYKKINSLILKATAFDSLFDAITTSTVLIANILSLNYNFPFDGIGGVIVSVVIFIGGIKITISSIKALLGEKIDKKTIDIINSYFNNPLILGTHDLLIHDYGVNRRFGSIHVEVDKNTKLVKIHEIIDEIEDKIYKDLNILITIHVDPIDNGIEFKSIKNNISKIIENLDTNFNLHDIRIISKNNKNIIKFDLVIPYNYSKFTKLELDNLIKAEINKIYPHFIIDITIEYSYS